MKRTFLLLLSVGVLWGCQGSPDPLKSGVQVSFATRNPAASGSPSSPMRAPASSAVTAGDTIRDGTNTLVIDKAEILLRSILLERAGVAACTTGTCETVDAGPVLVDLPLGAGAQARFTVNVPAATYDRVKFEVHKLSNDDPAEAAFRAMHPDFVGKSIRVQGTFNGVAFTYQTELGVEQELLMVPALVVADGTVGVNLTIRVTLAEWFRSTTGGLLGPATANKGGPNESVVNNSIKNSMKAFEDKDRDGDERDG